MLGNVLMLSEWFVILALAVFIYMRWTKREGRSYMPFLISLCFLNSVLRVMAHYVNGDKLSMVTVLFPVILLVNYWTSGENK
ncbi:hypothetical protein [Streptococcus sp. S784/96/1]|uniref:hypothetical protein n=1 Tax=Streptococcus sp. S784/96/1 TaxID=2653499 RepID=UPI00138A10F1|nr:hypothetical protein [Streptococcus sp. S784/96/1]